MSWYELLLEMDHLGVRALPMQQRKVAGQTCQTRQDVPATRIREPSRRSLFLAQHRCGDDTIGSQLNTANGKLTASNVEYSTAFTPLPKPSRPPLALGYPI